MGLCGAKQLPRGDGNNNGDDGDDDENVFADSSRSSFKEEDDFNNPLSAREIEERIASGKGEIMLTDTLKLEYGYVSQRGYYPDDMQKANQDNFGW